MTGQNPTVTRRTLGSPTVNVDTSPFLDPDSVRVPVRTGSETADVDRPRSLVSGDDCSGVEESHVPCRRGRHETFRVQRVLRVPLFFYFIPIPLFAQSPSDMGRQPFSTTLVVSFSRLFRTFLLWTNEVNHKGTSGGQGILVNRFHDDTGFPVGPSHSDSSLSLWFGRWTDGPVGNPDENRT